MSGLINPEEISVALLAGGRSAEREISLASGRGAQAALEAAGFKVTLLDPAVPGDLVKLIEGDFDVAFLALHGKFGEDGTIQGLLETIALPYTGSGLWSSALAIDKRKSKECYLKAGIPTPQSMCVTPATTAADVVAPFGDRCVVKAATEGSALGVYLCKGAEEVEQALKRVFKVDSQAFVESFIAGKEYTVAVLGNNDAFALPVIQIIPQNEFYDFESKYATGGSQHICPAPLNDADTKRAQELAVAAHYALGCKGVSRTDLIQDEQGLFWALETNTIPGMTETSLLPDAARAAGIEFPDLCIKLIEYALE